MKIFILLTCLIAPEVIFAQTGAPQSPAEKAARASNAFGFNLLAETMKGDSNVNVFQSPVGLALALGIVENGATGETAKQMGLALQQGGATMNEINRANKLLLGELLAPDQKSTLEIANGIWTQKSAHIKPEFLSSAQGDYQAAVASADFNDPATVSNINQWVSDKTHGKIPSMVTAPLEHGLKLMVLDAIYFKGAWVAPFDKKLTGDMPFNLADGTAVSQPRMSQTGRFGYFENTNFQAVLLPYTGRQVSLLIVLPKQSLADFTPELTLENWEHWMGRFKLRQGTVGLPRFKLDNELNLNHELTAMGMPRAFTWQAEFGGISDEGLAISWVMQKTHVEVNEEGTVAAAVSGVGIRPTIVQREIEAPFTMIVDKPFYAAIRDNRTGVILFHGEIFDPR